ncbi:enoyl-CoA hydratase [Rubrobacter indicoceani]|uniref:enoyl-CoA hydratase n=1 Tax=Rubrobacter indicoceani TaxID=2051957 RepID=UPI000E5B6A86|nr:enoyl-CoA hydratase [Rubrobacter indicoceani]
MIGAEKQTYENITVERDGELDSIVRVTMNRPKKRNALSLSHMEDLIHAFTQVESDRSVQAVILAGNGPAFCAGHDLKEMLGRDHEFYRRTFDVCTELMTKVQAIPQPVIAEVHSIATAAGCQLAATCDLVVAAEEAKFATPGVRIGLFCSTPMVALSRAVGQKKSMEMLLTGEFVGAEEAGRIGLANRVVPADRLRSTTRELARKISEASRMVVGIGKLAFYRQHEMPTSEAYAYTGEVMSHNATLADAQEGMGAFLEKRQPGWQNR